MKNKINSKTGLMAVVLVSAIILFSPVQANVAKMAVSWLKKVSSSGLEKISKDSFLFVAGVTNVAFAYTFNKDWQKKVTEKRIRKHYKNLPWRGGGWDHGDLCNGKHWGDGAWAIEEKAKDTNVLIDTFRVPVMVIGGSVAMLSFFNIVRRRNPCMIGKRVKIYL